MKKRNLIFFSLIIIPLFFGSVHAAMGFNNLAIESDSYEVTADWGDTGEVRTSFTCDTMLTCACKYEVQDQEYYFWILANRPAVDYVELTAPNTPG